MRQFLRPKVSYYQKMEEEKTFKVHRYRAHFDGFDGGAAKKITNILLEHVKDYISLGNDLKQITYL